MFRQEQHREHQCQGRDRRCDLCTSSRAWAGRECGYCLESFGMINSAEGEVLLQLSYVVTRTNLYKLKMAFRLELRKWVASCQISEQEEHETEKN